MKLEIPEAAYIAAANAYDKADPDQCWYDVVDAAAPLVIAAELRRLAQSHEPILRAARFHLRARANEIETLNSQKKTV
jgi:hypothetical protein